MLTLYNYYRSSAAYRVRIALNYKNIEHQLLPVHLVQDGGQQLTAEYKAINPQALVPTLQADDLNLTQSIAILEYLEERFPTPPLLPDTIGGRAIVRSLALLIACDIHPLDNLRVLKYLTGPMRLDNTQKMQWYRHWIEQGFEALETQLQSTSNGQYCYGDHPTVADLCLIPQVYNAHRFEVDMSPFPVISKINRFCLELDYFRKASPDEDPDRDS